MDGVEKEGDGGAQGVRNTPWNFLSPPKKKKKKIAEYAITRAALLLVGKKPFFFLFCLSAQFSVHSHLQLKPKSLCKQR